MKKFAQTAILIAGLAGLSACAADSSDVWTPYGKRTAGHAELNDLDMEGRATAVDTSALKVCRERETRLEAMNRSCYRK
jgi:hypothetical protein